MSSKKYTNRLSQESSPYLLQHAHNPVDWYPWGEEAFKKAQLEDKPILVSIGYSSCHWCHVMERESFENEEIAKFMNTYFINIKVDREERPDVDNIYMEAVQAITNGSGGWPLNCFLLPDGQPFFGGTYFPPQQAHNRPSWPMVLNNIANAFFNKRDEVEDQAKSVTEYVKRSDSYFLSKLDIIEEGTFTENIIQESFGRLKDNFDTVEGGFGHSPKFPSTMALRFCLNYHYYNKDEAALDHLNRSLKGMIFGGIYDQLGGGFARYSVDKEWLVPHFEKMLYDNALLINLMADAYQYTQDDLYKETIDETITWLEREMHAENGGFYAALDADSEGVEGKFYVWSAQEFSDHLDLGDEWALEFYDVSEEGNWEHSNILNRKQTLKEFAKAKNLDYEELKKKLDKIHRHLLTTRNQRIRPGLDDKIILPWNALLVTAFAKAYRATQNKKYKDTAEKTLNFLMETFKKEGASLYHTYKNGEAKYQAFLDDYANLIEACLEVYQISFDKKYLTAAQNYTQYCLDHFYDTEERLFYYTSSEQTDVILRKKNLYDNATPSGNSTMFHNLLKLGTFLDSTEYKTKVEKGLAQMLRSIQKFPQSFSNWANVLYPLVYGVKEIAVLGNDYKQLIQEVQQLYFPSAVLSAAKEADATLPLLKDKEHDDKTLLFLCENYACQRPVETLEEFKILLNS